jgi:hypothetical protein
MIATYNNKPVFILFAGVNGSGKSTLAYYSLSKAFRDSRFLNADNIARGLSPLAPEKVGNYWKNRSGAGKINDGITAYTVGDTVKDVYDAPAHDRGAEAKEAVLMTAASALTAKFRIIPKLLGLSAAGITTSVQGGKVLEDTFSLAPGVDHATADIWDTNIKHCFTMLIAAVVQLKDGNFTEAVDSLGSAFEGAPARGEQAEVAPQGATAQPGPGSSQEQNTPSEPQNPRELIDRELVESMQRVQQEGGTPDHATMGRQRTNEQQLATTGA